MSNEYERLRLLERGPENVAEFILESGLDNVKQKHGGLSFWHAGLRPEIGVMRQPIDTVEFDATILPELEEAQVKLAEIQAWTNEEAEIRARESYERLKSKAEEDELNSQDDSRPDNLEKSLEVINAWEPPDVEHIELKVLMINSITERLKQLRGGWPLPDRLSGEEYKQRKIDQAEHKVKGLEEKHRENMSQVARRNLIATFLNPIIESVNEMQRQQEPEQPEDEPTETEPVSAKIIR